MPDRVLQHALDQMRRDIGQPFRLDFGIDAAEQLAGLRQLRAHHPWRRLLRQSRAREYLEAATTRAVEVRLLAILLANVVDQAGQQALVDVGVELVERLVGLRLVGVLLSQNVDDLLVHRLPFLHPQIADEMLLAQLAQLAIGAGGTPLLVARPQVQQGQEIGLRMPPLGVLEARGILLIRRHVVRVLHRQRRGKHPDMLAIRRATPGLGNAGNARIERQPAQFAAQRGDALVVIERAQGLQQPVAIGDVPAFGCIKPREVLDIAKIQAGHLQDHAGQIRAQDFRIGEGRTRLEVLLVVEPQADAGADAAAAAGALVGRRLRYRFDLQLLHAEARRKAVDARRAGIDDVTDAGHGHRGFGDVGRQHDARRAAAGEHLVLLLRRQPRVQRQHFGTRKAARQAASQIVDLALAR